MDKEEKIKVALLFKKVKIGRIIIYGNKFKHVKHDFFECLDDFLSSVLKLIVTPFRLIKMILDMIPRIIISKKSIEELEKMELDIIKQENKIKEIGIDKFIK